MSSNGETTLSADLEVLADLQELQERLPAQRERVARIERLRAELAREEAHHGEERLPALIQQAHMLQSIGALDSLLSVCPGIPFRNFIVVSFTRGSGAVALSQKGRLVTLREAPGIVKGTIFLASLVLGIMFSSVALLEPYGPPGMGTAGAFFLMIVVGILSETWLRQARPYRPSPEAPAADVAQALEAIVHTGLARARAEEKRLAAMIEQESEALTLPDR